MNADLSHRLLLNTIFANNNRVKHERQDLSYWIIRSDRH